MATLVYKMTHKGDPNPELGWWGVADCMGQVRGFAFDAVIGIGGRSWWTNQTSRVGELVWIGLDPQQVPGGKRGQKTCLRPFPILSGRRTDVERDSTETRQGHA